MPDDHYLPFSPQLTHIIFAYERRRKINDRFFKKASKWFDWTLVNAGDIIEGADDKVTIYLMKKKEHPVSKKDRSKEGKSAKPESTTKNDTTEKDTKIK
jgi:hypothetical protein